MITLRERLERFCLTWLGALGCSHHTHPDICEGLFLGMDAKKSMKTGRFFSIHSIVHECASATPFFGGAMTIFCCSLQGTVGVASPVGALVV